MSTQTVGSVNNTFRVGFGLVGLVTLLVGISMLVAPYGTAAVATAFLAIYTIIVGVVYAGTGIFSGARGGWARIGLVLAGIVFVVAGIVAFSDIRTSAAFLAVIVAIFIGAAWFVEGVTALVTIKQSSSKVWTIVYAVISVIAGITLMTSPIWGAITLWWLVGITMIILGIVQIVRAFTFKP